MPNLAIAILAAGLSKRMGQPKQLLTFRGRTLLQNSIDVAQSTHCPSIFLVLNGLISVDVKRFEPRLIVLLNERHKKGLSSSIRVAVQHVLAISEIDGLIIMNCDQPNLDDKSLRTLISAFEDGKIVASSYGGTIGTPAIFAREFFSDLLDLRGDVGAKSVIKKYASSLVQCEMSSAQFDIDTPEDYNLLLKSE